MTLPTTLERKGTFELDLAKVRELAKPSHNTCLGNGVTGVVRGTNIHRICNCVWRKLRIQGVGQQDAWKHIAKSPGETA